MKKRKRHHVCEIRRCKKDEDGKKKIKNEHVLCYDHLLV